MEHIIFVVILFITTILFARVEIEIEGPSGWASNLPTKRFDPNHPLSRYLFGGRPATLYHVFVILFVFVMAHVPYITAPINLKNELIILSFVILFWCLEDFLWFVMNPAFGIKRFKRENIWWHKQQWWLIAPRDYFIFIPLGVGIYITAYLL